MVIQNCLKLLQELAEIEERIEKARQQRENLGVSWSAEDDERLLRSLINKHRSLH